MQFEFKFSKETVSFEIPEKNFYKELKPNKVEIGLTEQDEVKRSLKEPIASPRLKEIVKPGEKIFIITSDITRPMPSYKVLPCVLDEMKEAGVKEEDITVVLALGSHRSHTEAEKKTLVGEAVYNSKIKIIDSDMAQCINLGTCKNGTPVDIFEPVAKADRIICLGNVEYHYFAGYSGGAKALMPGVSSHAAIQANHSNMVKPEARTGNLETNPVRQDIDQITEFIKIDFIVNVVLNAKKEIIKAVSGHWKEAHREGCRFLDTMYGIEIEAPADIVVVTPGGFPKDINLYQSQKSLDNSKHAVKEGGVIVMLASAKEGFGEKTFEDWMRNKSPMEMIEEIKCNFKLGGHKAAAIASVIQKSDIYFVSDLDDELVRSINFIPFKTAQEAIDKALEKQGENAKILLMPAGGSTLPIVKK
ncbi:nickel-dependent lactate racemase [Fusibacter sp. Q10-2]|uniref:Nickel-dependent lactate racemase n=2 Tax=Fusibacter ferrireducens TaxID=2785058 RepID=A0ABR9ZX34_9FIRM|nr:nickel-dependent lactate racemase [Fusibacter ferrireducens]